MLRQVCLKPWQGNFRSICGYQRWQLAWAGLQLAPSELTMLHCGTPQWQPMFLAANVALILQSNKKLRSYGPGQWCWIGCFQRSCKLVRLNMDAPLVMFVNCRNTSAHVVNHRKFSCVETQHCTFRTCAAIHAGLESCKGHEVDNGLNDGCLPK